MTKRILFLWFILLSPVHAEDVILILGDSLSAGYGIPVQRSWVTLLQQRLDEHNYKYRVVNASISGETTRGALARLTPAIDTHKPSITIIELGANDGLRGFPPSETQKNLATMIEQVLSADSKLLMTKITLPPNYGMTYIKKFETVYDTLAQRYNIVLTPFILNGIAGNPELMQADGIHPVAKAQQTILDNLWPDLIPLL